MSQRSCRDLDDGVASIFDKAPESFRACQRRRGSGSRYRLAQWVLAPESFWRCWSVLRCLRVRHHYLECFACRNLSLRGDSKTLVAVPLARPPAICSFLALGPHHSIAFCNLADSVIQLQCHTADCLNRCGSAPFANGCQHTFLLRPAGRRRASLALCSVLTGSYLSGHGGHLRDHSCARADSFL